MTAGRWAKRIAERILVGSGAVSWADRRQRGRVRILAYHNVVPDGLVGVGDASLHLAHHQFCDQLDHIGRRYDVVPLASILVPPVMVPRRPRVAITFDDAYQGALVLGVEELARRGWPATMFVAPGLLGGQALWWDAIAPPGPAPDAPALTPAVRHDALSTHAGRGDQVRAWARSAGWTWRTVPAPALTGTENELEAAYRRHDGLTIGSHSWSHPNLARLDAAGLDAELRQSLQWLRERFDRAIEWLAYPYGISSPLVERAARTTGYDAAVLVAGGWATPAPRDRYAIPRANIPAGLSAAGFALRVSGVRGSGVGPSAQSSTAPA